MAIAWNKYPNEDAWPDARSRLSPIAIARRRVAAHRAQQEIPDTGYPFRQISATDARPMTELDHLLSSYRYDLPDELIARRPLERRRDSRLLVLRKDAARAAHRRFSDVLSLLQPGDVLVLNDTMVIPARLFAHKAETGGKVEILLSRPETDGRWIALLGSSKRPKPGTRLELAAQASTDDPTAEDASLVATVVGPVHDEPGAWLIEFAGDVIAWANRFGHLPLPPYLERSDDEADRERYQTVYANPEHAGAVAAPTAGLHFDAPMLRAIEERGVKLARVTLHVGPGTFLPVRENDVRTHQMHAEPWSISEQNAAILNEARAGGGRIVAVGTTSLRTLEAALSDKSPGAPFAAEAGLTRLFVRPGHAFRAVDALITNFHLPESTLLMLVAAICGRERILQAYRDAVAEKYRFFSYGDSSFLEVRDEAKA